MTYVQVGGVFDHPGNALNLNKMKIYIPFALGVASMLAGALVNPDQSVRVSPFFWGFVICFAYGFYRMWKGSKLNLYHDPYENKLPTFGAYHKQVIYVDGVKFVWCDERRHWKNCG